MRPIDRGQPPAPTAPPSVKRLPVYATQLVEELNASMPHRCIEPGQSEINAHRYAGARALIDSLMQRHQATVDSDPMRPVLGQ